MQTNVPRNNFSSGIISKEMSGLINNPIFQNGVDNLENFDLNEFGSISKRQGFKIAGKHTNTTLGSWFVKFNFNKEQQYILEFFNTNFCVWIQTSNNRLELYRENGAIKYFPHNFNSYFTQDRFKEINTTQNADVIYFTHKSFSPKTLTRTWNGNNLIFQFADVIFGAGTGQQNPIANDGYPSCACFYQNRLFYSGFSRSYNKIWASDTGYYNEFTTNREKREDILDIDGFNFSLIEFQLPIIWLIATGQGLVLGSADGLGLIFSQSEQITPHSFICKKINDNGSSYTIQPIAYENTLLYVDTTNSKIYNLIYDFQSSAYQIRNLNEYTDLLNGDIIKTLQIVNEVKNKKIYILTEGQPNILFVLFYNMQTQYYAWTKYTFIFAIENIYKLANYDYGDNFFILTKTNDFLLKTSEYKLRDIEAWNSNSELEQKKQFYRYLDQVINNFQFMDYSTYYNYNDRTQPLTINTIAGQPDKFLITCVFPVFTADTILNKVKNKDTLEVFSIIERRDDYTIVVTCDSELPQGQPQQIININNWQFLQNIIQVDTTLYPTGNDFDIFGDGYYEKKVLIQSNGNIQLPVGVYIGNFHIGYNYRALLKTMNLGGMIEMTNTMVMKKNINKIYLRLYNSWGGQFGTDRFNIKPFSSYDLKDSIQGQIYTIEQKDIKLAVTDSWQFNKCYYIQQDIPYPFCLNSISVEQDIE